MKTPGCWMNYLHKVKFTKNDEIRDRKIANQVLKLLMNAKAWPRGK